MPALTDALSRKWADARAAFELSCHSGSCPNPQADIDAILDEIISVVRSVGQEELEAIRQAFEGRPLPASGPAVTTDLPAANPEMTTELPLVGMTPDNTVPPDHTGASNADFELAAMPAAPNDGGPPDSRTGAWYIPASSAFDPTKPRPTPPDEKGRRKVPTVPGYQITGVLGRGGMGIVYRATQVGLNREVALKMILAGEHADPAHLARFTKEAEAVARIRHPNIVQIYQIGEYDGLPYFSLELCAGGSLDKKTRQGPLPPQEAALLTEKLARAISAAHAAGVIHRDLKPANVLLDADGTPKVTDFGLARATDAAAGLTHSGSVVGTPSYMAPEQARGDNREVGPASDQYSLGATLYSLITGRPPFLAASVMETLKQVEKAEPVPPTQLQPGCPRDLETICLKAMAKEPQKRYASCEALADDLLAYLDGRPITARPVGNVEKAWRWAKRNPGIARLSAAVTVLLLVLAVGGVGAAAVFDQKKREAVGLAEERRIAKEEAEKARDDLKVALDSEKAAHAAKTVAQREAEERFEYARQSLVGVIDDIPIALQQAVFARGAEQEVLQLLAGMLQKQINHDSLRGLPDRARHAYYLRLGGLLTRQGKLPEAEKSFADARAISARLLKTEQHEKDKAKMNHALVLRLIGSHLRDTRKTVEAGNQAIALFRQAEQLEREVLTAPLTKEIPLVEARQSLAATLYEIAETHRRMLDYAAALPPCEEALMLRAEVAAVPPTTYTRNAKELFAFSYVQLGKVRRQRGEDREAEEAFVKASDAFQELVAKDPANLALRLAAARAIREFGDFLLMRGRLPEATPFHERDLEWTRGLLTIPELAAVQSDVAKAYYRSATLALKKKNRAEATALYGKCLELLQTLAVAFPRDDRLRLRVAIAQAHCGLHAPAAATAEAMLAKYRSDGNVVYDTASILAVCADAATGGQPGVEWTADQKALRQMYTDRAIQLVEELTGRLKYTDVVSLRDDPDFEAVRADPRFQAIIRKLETQRPKK